MCNLCAKDCYYRRIFTTGNYRGAVNFGDIKIGSSAVFFFFFFSIFFCFFFFLFKGQGLFYARKKSATRVVKTLFIAASGQTYSRRKHFIKLTINKLCSSYESCYESDYTTSRKNFVDDNKIPFR